MPIRSPLSFGSDTMLVTLTVPTLLLPSRGHVGDKRPQIQCRPPSKLLDFHVGTRFTSSVTSHAIVEVFRFLTKT